MLTTIAFFVGVTLTILKLLKRLDLHWGLVTLPLYAPVVIAFCVGFAQGFSESYTRSQRAAPTYEAAYNR